MEASKIATTKKTALKAKVDKVKLAHRFSTCLSGPDPLKSKFLRKSPESPRFKRGKKLTLKLSVCQSATQNWP